MIIYGPNHVEYDTDLGPVFITDWYHRSYLDIVEDIMSTNVSEISHKKISLDRKLIFFVANEGSCGWSL